MSHIHFTLQGKGGVGKSFVSSLIAQYLLSKERPLTVIDADPVNSTLSSYPAFKADSLSLMENHQIVPRKFDTLIETIMSSEHNFVIDNGASSFIPLIAYLHENSALEFLADHGKNVFIHTIMAGGGSYLDTLSGTSSLITQIPASVKVIIWLNEFFGSVEQNGVAFENSSFYKTHKSRITGMIPLPQQTASTFGQDIQTMIEKRLTFDEVSQSSDFGIMARSRLHKVKTGLFSSMAIHF